MKKIIAILGCAWALTLTTGAYAQQDTTVGQKVKTGAKKAANKTSEVAAKGAAAVVDQVYKGKVGPDGQTIYIDNHSKYYYINDKGHKVYVPKAQLKDKM